jgi:hypothetical protein
MKRTFVILFISAFWILLAFAFSASAQKKKTVRCKTDIPSVKYEIGSGFRSKPIQINIYVDPELIEKDVLIQLAKTLKAEFCNEEKAQFIIFDDRKHINSGDALRDYVDSGGKLILMRGFYSFDRKTGKDTIEFSKKPGNPTTEVQIDLSKEN